MVHIIYMELLIFINGIGLFNLYNDLINLNSRTISSQIVILKSAKINDFGIFRLYKIDQFRK